MELLKNQVVTLTIEDMSSEGEGIGKVDGYTIFVKDAIIGDCIEAKIIKPKKNYAFARLLSILEPSSHRIEAKCEFHRQCGGCQLQTMSYAKQLEFKKNKVKNHLKRIGKFDESFLVERMEQIYGMENPYYYRNKAQFPVGMNKEGETIIGFYAGRTHSIIPNTNCMIGSKINKSILETVLEFMKLYQISPYDEVNGSGLIRHILIREAYHTKEIMICLIINKDVLPHQKELIKMLLALSFENNKITSISININRENTNVIMGKKTQTIWGNSYITDYIGNISFQISPQSFYQVNSKQMEVLYQIVLDYADLKHDETVWDLYCGIGTISLFLAKRVKRVYGVEIIPEAIRDAKENAVRNEIDNAEFFVGKAEEIVPKMYQEKNLRADVVVVDPPRKGCDEILLQTISEMQPDRIVYVSCDSATLARDLRYLSDQGYELRKFSMVDLFGQTVHVETVCLLSRKA